MKQMFYKKSMRMANYLVICLISVQLFSCTKKVSPSELNFEYKDYLVVDGLLTNEKKEHEIVLSHSMNFTGTDTPRMETGAKVSISDGDTIVYLTEKSAGKYTSSPDFAGVIDKTYTLNIQLTNGQQYNASCYLNPAMVIDTMYSNYESEMYGIYLKAHSKNRRGASCIMNLFVNDSLVTKNLMDKKIYAMGGFYEKIFEVSESLLKRDTSWVGIQMYSIPYQMYQYIDDIKNETVWSVEWFRTSPDNVRTNISDGGLGFFLASEVTMTKIQVVKLLKE